MYMNVMTSFNACESAYICCMKNKFPLFILEIERKWELLWAGLSTMKDDFIKYWLNILLFFYHNKRLHIILIWKLLSSCWVRVFWFYIKKWNTRRICFCFQKKKKNLHHAIILAHLFIFLLYHSIYHSKMRWNNFIGKHFHSYKLSTESVKYSLICNSLWLYFLVYLFFFHRFIFILNFNKRKCVYHTIIKI